MQFKKETYSIQAAAYIRNLIRSGALKPGQPVREAQISEELNISRAPIREALRRLAQACAPDKATLLLDLSSLAQRFGSTADNDRW